MATTEKEIREIEDFFRSNKPPKEVKLGEGITVTDTVKFISSHLAVLRNNGEKPMYEVFYLRLLKLKEIVSNT